MLHAVVLVLDALDEFGLGAAEVEVLVVFELQFHLLLHFGEVAGVLAVLHPLQHQLLRQLVQLALQVHVLAVELFRLQERDLLAAQRKVAGGFGLGFAVAVLLGLGGGAGFCG